MNEVVLAADLGGTNLRMAVVDPLGEILHLARHRTPENVSPLQLIELVRILAGECLSALSSHRSVVALGFGSPSPASKNSDGILTKLPNLPSLNGMELGAQLRGILNLPVVLENDATAAAIGEHWLGASRSISTSIMITLGTGVGGGLIIDREPYRGIDGTAGEIGHIVVEPDGHPCGCGSRGCIEQYASATAIVRMSREAGLSLSSSREVYDAARAGNVNAQDILDKMSKYLGIALAGLVNVLNPEMIVIGGGVAAGWDAFIDPLKAEISARAFEAPAKRAIIMPAALGDNAGIVGVARSAFQSVKALS